MANWGFSNEEIKVIRRRDKNCVYCRKQMLETYNKKNYVDSPTIEHLHHKWPFRKKDGLLLEGLAIACGSCNSSRGKLELGKWLEKKRIEFHSVAQPVRSYLANRRQ